MHSTFFPPSIRLLLLLLFSCTVTLSLPLVPAASAAPGPVLVFLVGQVGGTANQNAAEQAKNLRNQGFSLMRSGRTTEALAAYRNSLQYEDDATVQSIVKKLEAQLAKEKDTPSPSSAPTIDSNTPSPTPVLSAPSAPASVPGQALSGSDTDKAKQLRQQAFALSSQGRTKEAAVLYKQSLQYEDSPQVRMILSRLEQAETRKVQAQARAKEQHALASRHAPGMSTSQIKDAQKRLAKLGYTPGPADGVIGQRTVEALRTYQRDQGLAQDGVLNLSLAARLESAETTSTAQPQPLASGGGVLSGLPSMGSSTTGDSTAPSPSSSSDVAVTTTSPDTPPQSSPYGQGGNPYGQTGTTPTPNPQTAPTQTVPIQTGQTVPTDCEQAETALTAETERIMMESDSKGMCWTSTEYHRVMLASAALMRRCPALDPDGAQAREYDKVAAETQQSVQTYCK